MPLCLQHGEVLQKREGKDIAREEGWSQNSRDTAFLSMKSLFPLIENREINVIK